ncbi:hypothetical protein [Brumimicrobium oceani]|uniref:hypothetical protein n=1 Tax=Brumimicrobium oceani TaxID=2100725 RepID=UPI001E4760CB|nr:hypothetical protein [Brumimicrobium oceani]
MKNSPNSSQISQWLAHSKRALQNTERFSSEELQTIQAEIEKREALVKDLETANLSKNALQFEGSYNIIGLNQDEEQGRYFGFLHISKVSEIRVNAEWVINGEQVQQGSGFFHGDTLIINFSYEGEEDNEGKIYKGVVVYKLINNVILTGFWSEKHGNDEFLGFEEGRKLKESETIWHQAKMN